MANTSTPPCCALGGGARRAPVVQLDEHTAWSGPGGLLAGLVPKLESMTEELHFDDNSPLAMIELWTNGWLRMLSQLSITC